MSLVEQGAPPDTDAVRQLLDRFVDAGALHPLPDTTPYTAADVTVVMPAFGRTPVLPTGARVIVVDDGSSPPLELPTDHEQAQLVRLERNQGPAAARNAGLAHVATPLVAFVDNDVELTSEWMTSLLVHFADPRVALVAPRVIGAPGRTRLGRYEHRHSPLDLGAEPARVAAGTRVSYVPAAALLCRVDRLREIGGFDESMRVGEDVDLVWRLIDAGHRCRYEPTTVVEHEARRSLAAFVRQRMGYGRSAAPLAVRHPGALAPARMSSWSVAVWVLLAARRPIVATTLAAGTAVALQRKLRHLPPEEIVRLVGLGHLAAGRQLADLVRRAWWPLGAAALVWRPTRRIALLAFTAPVVVEALRSRSVQPLLDWPLRTVDDAAYGAGVWWGVYSERHVGALLPDLTPWPPRAGG
jgi:mycofactocin system glycosyltransferase